MIRRILVYGAPELQEKSIPVIDFDNELRNLAQDMLETMYAAPGIGLAAPQIGINVRLRVVDLSAGEEAGHQLVLANPEITDKESSEKGEEGCLSVPGFTAMVERPTNINVRGKDIEGQPREIRAEGLLARALCHEIDHLDGILYLDRLSVLKRDLIRRKIRKKVRAGEW